MELLGAHVGAPRSTCWSSEEHMLELRFLRVYVEIPSELTNSFVLIYNVCITTVSSLITAFFLEILQHTSRGLSDSKSYVFKIREICAFFGTNLTKIQF